MGTLQPATRTGTLQPATVTTCAPQAKTIRNDNSSRFGKYISIFFDNSGAMLGAGEPSHLNPQQCLAFENMMNPSVF
jgi:hypothetical protein